MKKNIILLCKLYVFIVSLLVVFSSCSKLEMKQDIDSKTATLVINVAGAKNTNENLTLKASAGYGNMVGLATNNNEYINKTSTTRGNLRMDFISKQDIIDSKLAGSNQLEVGKKLAALVPLEGNIKYVFVLKNEDTGLFYEPRQLSAGTAVNIGEITPGISYSWYAYSYNTEENISLPVRGGDNKTVDGNISTYYDKALLYAKGHFSAVGGTNSMSIEFNHQLAQINVEVSVKKAYAAIVNITGTLVDHEAKVQVGTFDFLTGQLSNLQPSSISGSLAFSAINPNDASTMVSKFYTANTDLDSYSINLTQVTIRYPDNSTFTFDESYFPSGGTITFSNFIKPNPGEVLKGKLNLALVLPEMKIMTFSNNVGEGQYRLGPTTGAGYFVRNTKWFGPDSDYVAIKNIVIDIYDNGSAGVRNIKAQLSNPANYPDVLIIANYHNYLDFEFWDYVLAYIDAGGVVFNTQDEKENVVRYNPGQSPAIYYGPADEYFMSKLFNLPLGTIKFIKSGEDYGVYKFVDTYEAEEDNEILNGVFGDVRPYHWGQDRSGTTYATGYNGNDAIVYSTHAQNRGAPSVPGMAFFRHKTKKYFYAGDGGFFANPKRGNDGLGYKDYPFRTYTYAQNPALEDFPIISTFGVAASSNSPTYTLPAGYTLPGTTTALPSNYYRTAGRYQVVNSMIFGNMMSWMLEQAYFFPVDKTGPILSP